MATLILQIVATFVVVLAAMAASEDLDLLHSREERPKAFMVCGLVTLVLAAIWRAW